MHDLLMSLSSPLTYLYSIHQVLCRDNPDHIHISFTCYSQFAAFFCFRRFIPIWRSTFTYSAAFPARIQLSSLQNPISSSQCRRLLVPQWALLLFSTRSQLAVYGIGNGFSCFAFFCYCWYAGTNPIQTLPFRVTLLEPDNTVFYILFPYFLSSFSSPFSSWQFQEASQPFSFGMCPALYFVPGIYTPEDCRDSDHDYINKLVFLVIWSSWIWNLLHTLN